MSRLVRRPPGPQLPELVGLLRRLPTDALKDITAELRESELDARWRAERLRASVRVADNVAKFGGGSLLTTTIALVLGGKFEPLIVGVAMLTLLVFVAATMWSSIADRRAVDATFTGERLAAALKELGDER